MIKKSLIAISAKIIASSTGFLLTMLLPKFLSLEMVGNVYFFMAQATLFSLFFRFGLDYGVGERIIEYKDDYSKVSCLIATSYFFTSLFFLSLLLFLDQVFEKINFSFYALFLGFFYGVSFLIYQAYRYQGRVFVASLTRSFIHNFSIILALSFFYQYNEMDLFSFILAFSISIIIINTVIFSRKIKLTLPKTTDIKSSIASSKSFFLYALLLYFSSDLDIWLIQYYLSSEELAVYGTAKRLSILIAIFIDIGNLVLPSIIKKHLLNNNSLKAEKSSRCFSSFSMLLSSLSIVIFWLFGEWFILKFFTPEYLLAYDLTLLFLFSFLVIISLGFSEILLTILGRKDVLIWSLICSLLCNIGLNYILADIFGVYGVAVSFCLSSIIFRLLLSLFLSKKLGFNLHLFTYGRIR